MTETTRARVARGAALLDRTIPDWWKRVSVETLNQAYGSRCVLGQLFRSDEGDNSGFKKGIASLFGLSDDESYNYFHEDVVAHGFNSRSGNDADTAEWKRVINARLDDEQRRENMMNASTPVEPAVVINQFHLAAAQARIADAIQNHETRIPDLTEAGVLLLILNDLGVTSLVKVN